MKKEMRMKMRLIIKKLLSLIFDWSLVFIAMLIVYMGTDTSLIYLFATGIGLVLFSSSYFIWLSGNQTFGDKVLGIYLVPLDEKIKTHFKWKVFFRNLIYNVLIFSVILSHNNIVELLVIIIMFIILQLKGPHKIYGNISTLDFATKTHYTLEKR